jgi:DNA replication protein DnaC
VLNHPTVSKLHTLRLTGMATALHEQSTQPDIGRLAFDERLGLLVDREMTERDSRRLKLRLSQARLRQSACLEDIDYRAARGLDRTLMAGLATGQWLREHLNILITGKSGVGKSWIACALANQACRLGFTARYQRFDRLLTDMTVARGDGRYARMLAQIAKTDLICIDDFALNAWTDVARRDLLEILDDRHGTRSTIVTAQIPVKKWHEAIGDPTLADAILDRLVHNSYRIELTGLSQRPKIVPRLTEHDPISP